ncbi:MAG: hypothetical protein ABIN36_14990 [Ferruginibacter sp.]
MKLIELFGKTITNIYTVTGIEQKWLSTAECFIELDNNLIVDLPFGSGCEVWVKEMDPKAVSIFGNIEDYPCYHVNKEGKTVGEIVWRNKRKGNNILNRFKKIFFRDHAFLPVEYQLYKIEYLENKLKHIRNRMIVDFIFNDDDNEKGFLILDNGYVISKITMAPKGIGVGIKYYESVSSFEASHGTSFKHLSGNE